MVVLCIWIDLSMATHSSSANLVHQHLAVDHAQAVFFGEVLDLDDGKHGEEKC